MSGTLHAEDAHAGSDVSAWIQSDNETRHLREAHDAPSEATVFRKGDLVAMTYCDRDGLWHLLLSVKHSKRVPEFVEVLQARQALLPGVENFQVTAGTVIETGRSWLPPVPLFHVIELPEDNPPGRLQ